MLPPPAQDEIEQGQDDLVRIVVEKPFPHGTVAALMDPLSLVSAHPLDAGTELEVRVDHAVGKRTDSFEANTEGTLRLESIPKDGESLDGHPVRGSFDSSGGTRRRNEGLREVFLPGLA